jgi:DNA-binding cell septation regulator SpoVG
MNIAGVMIRKTFKDGKVKAIASITIDYDFVVVFKGIERTFVAMLNHRIG